MPGQMMTKSSPWFTGIKFLSVRTLLCCFLLPTSLVVVRQVQAPGLMQPTGL